MNEDNHEIICDDDEDIDNAVLMLSTHLHLEFCIGVGPGGDQLCFRRGVFADFTGLVLNVAHSHLRRLSNNGSFLLIGNR